LVMVELRSKWEGFKVTIMIHDYEGRDLRPSYRNS
jgi:hypothetical protein